MSIFPIAPVDNMTMLEFFDCKRTVSDTIVFCQNLGLLPLGTPKVECPNRHIDWYLGVFSDVIDGYVWRCKICKARRSIRDDTFFSGSHLTLSQMLDLIFYWSQKIDSVEFLHRHCKMQ
ncbi:unnamed protein product, partial [Didymodactylos carnosus]